MKYNGFYFWMFKSSMKKVLAEKYGKAYAAITLSRETKSNLVNRCYINVL